MATKKCPFCAEEIQAAAIKCKHCGEMLDQQITASPSPSPEPSSVEALGPPPIPWHQKGWVILLLLFIFFPVGVVLLWKNKSYSFTLKAIGTVCFGIFFIIALATSDENQESPPRQAVTTKTSTQEAEPTSTPPAVAPAPASVSWQTAASWSGSGIKETESFNISSREWRIKWRTHSEAFSGAGIFQIFVHDDAGGMVTLAANKQGTGEDVSYVRSGPGRHYLKINSGNVEWEVTVEDQR